jgi:hypothetical protein
VRCVVASLSIAAQIPKAARGRAHTPKVRQLPDKKVSLLTLQRFNQSRGACRIRSLQNKTQIEIDMFLQILVINDAPLLKPREIKEREKKNRVNRLGRFNEKHQSTQTPSHEKEIRFQISIL